MKRVEADVVVIAAGTAGLAAAVTAAEGGARVIVFEKRGRTGGAANMANMVFAVESRRQRQQGVTLTREEALKIHMDYTHWRVDARLVKAYYDKSASTIDWLEKLGVEFEDFPETGTTGMGHYNTAHVVKAPPLVSPKNIGQLVGAAAVMMKVLTGRARELGVQIFLKTPAQKILRRGGRIVGVIAEDETGEEIRANAKAVIVATGGFSDNPEWIKKYCGYAEGRDLFTIKLLGVKGDGIRMAWEVGAAATEMHMALMHHLPPPCQGPGGTATEFAAFRQPNLMVNLLGERFINEDVEFGEYMGNAISAQKNRAALMIFDENTKKQYEGKGLDIPVGKLVPRPKIFKHDDLDDNIREMQERGYKHLFVTNSLEELCAQTGIDLKGLQKTVAEYNQACETGRDELFHKDPQYLRPVKQPKFYAARFFPGAYGTVGGIKINYKTEVLTKDYKVIPGLYAAGSDANAIYGDSYTRILAGNYMGFALNTGRIAGESALEYLKSTGK
jgi:fumarate reductase flavoprotein subunit